MRFVTLKFLSALTAVLILLLFLSSRAEFARLQVKPPPANAISQTKTASEEPSPTASLSNSELAKEIDTLIDSSESASARWGISVISLTDGSTLYARNADKLFTPASNMKVFTTGVALDLLGADYRWRTSVYSQAQPNTAGTVQGDLILYGRGAPDLVSKTKSSNEASLARLAEDLYVRGVRRITGNIIGDESYFRGNLLGDGWQWTDIQWYYGAEASALSINENQADINLLPSTKSGTPPDVRTNDSTGLLTVENRMASANNATRPTIGLHRGLSDNNVRVWGEFGPGTRGFGARLSIHNPALWAATLFMQELKSKGITVNGKAVSRDSRVSPAERFNPTANVELAFVNSKSLAEIVRTTNKESNNLYAELILRTLGRERGAMLQTDAPPGRELGDDEAGLEILRLWLARASISPEHLALHDGSGLSRLNLVTPQTTSKMLAALSKMAIGGVFRESLPTAGKDGTLAGRLSSLTDRLSAKTGSLTYDNSLSGYVTTSDGKSYAFSILCNDHTGRRSSIRTIDGVATLLASFPQNLPKNVHKHQ